jgi:chromosome segregation ATPase
LNKKKEQYKKEIERLKVVSKSNITDESFQEIIKKYSNSRTECSNQSVQIQNYEDKIKNLKQQIKKIQEQSGSRSMEKQQLKMKIAGLEDKLKNQKESFEKYDIVLNRIYEYLYQKYPDFFNQRNKNNKN